MPQNSIPATSVPFDLKKSSKSSTGLPISRIATSGCMVVALLLFLLQTLPYLSYRWVTDESWFAGTAYSIYLHQGVANPAFGSNYLVSHFDAHPPGTAIVIAQAFHLFGVDLVSARLGSVLAGIAIILFTFFLANDLVGRQGALIAAFLVATDNFVVITARTARPEALTTFVVLTSLLAINQFAKTRHIFWAFASGFLMAMATMFHVTVAGFVLSFGVLALLLGRRHSRVSPISLAVYGCGYLAGLLPFAIWILTAPLGKAGFCQEYLSRTQGPSLALRFLQEGERYSDLIGLHMMDVHGLESIPVRLPIPLFFLAASFLLWKLRRQWFYLEVLLILPTVLWLAYLPDKMSRYLVLLAPFFALAIAAAISSAGQNRQLRKVMISLSCLVIIAQFSANLLLLSQARKADFNRVAAELRNAIPPDQTAYGTVTFWMALHDRKYISYERTDPWMAANRFHARYFIADDRVMVNGLPDDQPFYQRLRQSMAEIEAQSKLISEISDPYYGDLKIYRFR